MKAQHTKTKDGYRWVLAMRGTSFVAYPQLRCTTDTGAVYFKFCHAPVAYFDNEKERSKFIADGPSAKYWAIGIEAAA